MKLRTLPLAVVAAVAVLIPVNAFVPAYAAPDAPGLTVDSSVAGTVSGTVSSIDQPHVLVALVGASDSGDPSRTDVVLADGNTYSFSSWGYGSGTTVQAWACPTSTFVDTDCSVATVSAPFTPTDTDPALTFSSDHTIGPADDVSLSVADTGGGLLFGQWDDGDLPLPARFSVGHSATDQTVTVREGDGVVRLYRCDDAQQDHCVEETGSPSPTYQVRRTITAAIGPITAVSSAHPTTSFDVTTDVTTPRTGTYNVTWHLESAANPGTPIDGYGATTSSAALVNGVAQDIPLDATDLPNGNYLVKGTITVVDADFGTYTDVAMTPGTLTSGGDVTPPTVTSIKPVPTKIYPLISGNSTYKSSTKITVTGAGVPEIATVRITQETTNKLVRTLTLTQVDATHATTTWNGRWWSSTGTPVPSGTYLIKVRDAAGNESPTVGQVIVSGYRLITKTWTHTYTPAGTLADKYVGRCSTLRKPSLRGWYNSLGYYANTICSSTTSKDSLVSTLHAVFLPKAVQYVDIHVNVYGGAARAKPGSKAIVRYLTTSGDWASDKTLSATLGTHSGYTRSTSGLVFKDHSFGWGLYTGFGYQYDVKSFTVVLHYKALG